MIIVELMGGLGNQMFQYALGRHLAEKHGTELQLDLRALLDRTPRKNFIFRDYDIGIFNICERFASEEDIHLCCNKVIKEKKHYVFDEEVLNIPDNSYLVGYWQNEKYFKDIADIIRAEFTFRRGFDPAAEKLAEQIRSVNAVCMNVRRGDYVTLPTARKWHGLCEIEYYEKAISFIAERVSDPHIFIFSDDIAWCEHHFINNKNSSFWSFRRVSSFLEESMKLNFLKKTYLHLSYPTTFVSHHYAGEKFGDYLHLMSLCKHFIIPNSSFGWWAAWLCTNPDKIIIAPQKWVNDPSIDTSDVTPSSWRRM